MSATHERLAGLGIALALHAAAIWALLQFEGVRRAILEAGPIMVSFIAAPTAKPRLDPVPRPPPPVRNPAAQPPLLATQAIESPAPWTAPEPARDPLPAPVEASPPAAVTPPEFGAAYLRNPLPAYPPVSRRYREQGKVVLRVYVNASGAAERVEVELSSGWPRLDASAQEAVRAWHFVPAREGDKAVPGWVNVPINFKLEG